MNLGRCDVASASHGADPNGRPDTGSLKRAREFMAKDALAAASFTSGLDSAILIGHPAAISQRSAARPDLAILLSIILPGNHTVILFADLAVIPFVVALFCPINARGNIVRMVSPALWNWVWAST